MHQKTEFINIYIPLFPLTILNYLLMTDTYLHSKDIIDHKPGSNPLSDEQCRLL